MLKFDNTSALLPRFSVFMPSFATKPVVFYSRLPKRNCCRLPHVLPIAFSRVDADQIQHNTALPWFKRARATQTGTLTTAASLGYQHIYKTKK